MPIATADTWRGQKIAKERRRIAKQAAKEAKRLTRALENREKHLGHEVTEDPTNGRC